MTPNDFQRLKNRIEQLKQTKARAEGEAKALMRELEGLGFGSVKEAKRELNQLRRRERDLVEAWTEAIANFEDRWADRLG